MKFVTLLFVTTNVYMNRMPGRWERDVEGIELWDLQFKSTGFNVEFMAVRMLLLVVSQGPTLAKVVAAVGSHRTESLPVIDCYQILCRVSVLHFDCPALFLHSPRGF
jgi:hypothetical protein